MRGMEILFSMLPRLSRSVAVAAWNTDQYWPGEDTRSVQVAAETQWKTKSCKYSLSRGWEGGVSKTGRWRTMCWPGPGERKREEGTKTRGKPTKGVTHMWHTKLPNIHRHIKATTSHAFICRCYNDTTGQNLKSQIAAQKQNPHWNKCRECEPIPPFSVNEPKS